MYPEKSLQEEYLCYDYHGKRLFGLMSYIIIYVLIVVIIIPPKTNVGIFSI